MRKTFLFCALMAVIAMMTGCQKEQEGSTLKAVIDQDTKTYIGQIGSTSYPFWESGDQVIIHGVENVSMVPYSIVPSTTIPTNGTINGVEFEAPYCAVFPARLVEDMGAISSSSCTAHIYLNTHQKYQEVSEGGPQKVEMPMAAFTAEGTTLYFKNLCSVIRVDITTDDNVGQFQVRSISVDAGTAIAGHCTATISPSGVTLTEANLAENKTVTLHKEDFSTMGTISTDSPKSFYIVVPPFGTETNKIPNVKITVETEDGRYFSKEVNNVYIERSKIAPISLDAGTHTNLVIGTETYLESGEAFHTHCTTHFSGCNSISFRNVWSESTIPSEAIDVRDPSHTEAPGIWAYQSGSTMIVATTANTIYANASCKKMFQNLTTVSNIQANGVNFNTRYVTDMSFMFAGCEALGSASIHFLHLNTSNVTNMEHMFDGCSSLGQGGLSLRTFDTHNVTGDGMVAMFNGCSSMQSLDLSSFNTEGITNFTDFFNGCGAMRNLDIRHFTIGEGDTKTGMCSGLQNQNLEGTIVITCTEAVSNRLLQNTGENGTGLNQDLIDNHKIDWHLVPEQ